MDEVKLSRLAPGLPVSDVAGAKIGTLAHVHQRVSEEGTVGTESATATTAVDDKIVEVKTGPLGLGKHMYIPTQAIETVTDDQVVLNCSREEVEQSDWSNRPPNLRQVT